MLGVFFEGYEICRQIAMRLVSKKCAYLRCRLLPIFLLFGSYFQKSVDFFYDFFLIGVIPCNLFNVYSADFQLFSNMAKTNAFCPKEIMNRHILFFSH